MSHKVSPSLSQKKIYLHLIILSLAILLTFGYTVTFDFTNWDDPWLIVENTYLQNLTWERVGQIFNPFYHRRPFGGEYLPLKELSYALDYQLFGLNPAFYHGENVLLYLLGVLVLYFFLRRLLDHSSLAFWTALIFALHPLHSESVSWVSARKDLLAGLFFFLALFFYLPYSRENQKKAGWAAALAFGAGLFSKNIVISLPALLVALDFYLHRQKSRRRALIDSLWRTAPFWAMSLVMLVLSILIGYNLDIVSSSIREIPFLTRWGLASQIGLEYLVLLVFPWDFSPVHPLSLPSPGVTPYLFPLFLFGALCLTLVYIFWRYRNLWGLAGIFFLLTYLPVSNLIAIPVFKANRYLFLPTLGYALFLAYLFHWMAKKAWKKSPYLLFVPLSVISLYYGAVAARESLDWKDTPTLWKEVKKHYPDSTLPYVNLGVYYLEEGEYDKGKKWLVRALEIDPGNEHVHYNLGVLAMKKEDWPQAWREFATAERLGRRTYDVYLRLGQVWGQMGEMEKARSYYKRALEKFPPGGEAHLELAKIYWKQENKKRARHHLDRALQFPGTQKEAREIRRIWR